MFANLTDAELLLTWNIVQGSGANPETLKELAAEMEARGLMK